MWNFLNAAGPMIPTERFGRPKSSGHRHGRCRPLPYVTLLVIALAAPLLGQSPSVRDWRYWPFTQNSPWNMPIGSGAQYAPVSGLGTLPSGLNYNDAWTSSIVIATSSDPVSPIVFKPAVGASSNWNFLSSGGKVCGNSAPVEAELMANVFTAVPFQWNYYSTTVATNSNLWSIPSTVQPATVKYTPSVHLPRGACPSPDMDALMSVFQPNGLVLDTYNTVVTSGGTIISSMASFVDARGDGTGLSNGRRASLIPSFAGLIRKGEIGTGSIPHALAAEMPQSMLQPKAVWPAMAFDRNNSYTGRLPMGALLAIPSWVDIDTLGLSPQGRIIAQAAQDYGVYVVDSDGAGITFLAELDNPEIRWDGNSSYPPWWRDMELIVANLEQVTNNTPSTPGGGGARRVPMAPPFYDALSQ